MKVQFILMTALFVGMWAGQTKADTVADKSVEWSSQQEAQFLKKLQDEITKQSKEILDLENQVNNRKKEFKGDFKKEFEDKIASLEAKQILYKKFQDSSSLKSSAVRAKLLEIFQKQIIKQQDIQDLQTFVDNSKSKS